MEKTLPKSRIDKRKFAKRVEALQESLTEMGYRVALSAEITARGTPTFVEIRPLGERSGIILIQLTFRGNKMDVEFVLDDEWEPTAEQMVTLPFTFKDEQRDPTELAVEYTSWIAAGGFGVIRGDSGGGKAGVEIANWNQSLQAYDAFPLQADNSSPSPKPHTELFLVSRPNQQQARLPGRPLKIGVVMDSGDLIGASPSRTVELPKTGREVSAPAYIFQDSGIYYTDYSY